MFFCCTLMLWYNFGYSVKTDYICNNKTELISMSSLSTKFTLFLKKVKKHNKINWVIELVLKVGLFPFILHSCLGIGIFAEMEYSASLLQSYIFVNLRQFINTLWKIAANPAKKVWRMEMNDVWKEFKVRKYLLST